MPPESTLDPDRQSTLGQMLGHETVREYLKRAVAQGQLPQALLIMGPAGVGKRTLAWSLAKEIVSEGKETATHRGAGKISRGTHPDVILCDNSKSPSGQILVETMRDMEDRAMTSPLEAPKKIAIIAPAEKMNISAANALLKLLEEPARHLVMILIASDPGLLLPTIRSRCTPLTLEAVPPATLAPWLVERGGATRERAELAAELAEGRPGLALSLVEDGALDARRAIIGELETLKAHGFASIFGVAERLASAGDDLASTLNAALVVLRDALAISLGAGAPLNRDLATEIARLAEGLSPAAILQAAERVEAAVVEAGDFYTAGARAHFVEILVASVGRELRSS